MNAVAELPVAKPNCFGLHLPHGIGFNYAAPYIICRGVMAGLAYRGTAQANRPVYTSKTKIAGWGDVVVHQTAGHRLDQISADVYFELSQLALAQELQPGQRIIVDIGADELTERLGWGRGSGQRERLHKQLTYLKTASFLYDLPGLREWQCSFVSDIASDRSTRDIKSPANYRIELNGNMLQVFAAGAKIIPGKVRRQLKLPLARALHAFYCTHSAPDDYNDATLKRIMSREGTSDKEWRADIDAAVTAMAAATGWTCDYNRKTGKVHVCKSKVVADEESQQDPAPATSSATPDTNKASQPAAEKVPPKAPASAPAVAAYAASLPPPPADPVFAARERISGPHEILALTQPADLLALLGAADQAAYAQGRDIGWLRERALAAWVRHAATYG